MCTLSWDIQSTRYTIFFNRDEQRTRQKAVPPKQFSFGGVNVLMPQDPDGGGTWISTNEFGLSLCLLNLYQGNIPSGKLTSRGQLVKELSIKESLLAIDETLKDIELARFAPFSLVVFDHQQLVSTERNVPQLRSWDGDSLIQFDCPRPFTSSSVKFEEVRASRVDYFREHLEQHSAHPDQPPITETLQKFHTGHNGQPGYRSVCLHREDATSVSLSRIDVDHKTTYFDYHDGAPCELVGDEFAHRAQLART